MSQQSSVGLEPNNTETFGACENFVSHGRERHQQTNKQKKRASMDTTTTTTCPNYETISAQQDVRD